MGRILGGIALAIGAFLATSPWWMAELPVQYVPVMVSLGAIFGGTGVILALSENRAPRLRTLAIAVATGGFGIAFAALALAPMQADADGTYTIGGIPGFVVDLLPMPWWARAVAGFFAVVMLGLALASVWKLPTRGRGTWSRGPLPSRPDTFRD